MKREDLKVRTILTKGNETLEFESITSCARHFDCTPAHISTKKTIRGYKIKFHNPIEKINNRPIEIYSFDGNYVTTCHSLTITAKYLKTSKQCVYDALNRNQISFCKDNFVFYEKDIRDKKVVIETYKSSFVFVYGLDGELLFKSHIHKEVANFVGVSNITYLKYGDCKRIGDYFILNYLQSKEPWHNILAKYDIVFKHHYKVYNLDGELQFETMHITECVKFLKCTLPAIYNNEKKDNRRIKQFIVLDRPEWENATKEKILSYNKKSLRKKYVSVKKYLFQYKDGVVVNKFKTQKEAADIVNLTPVAFNTLFKFCNGLVKGFQFKYELTQGS